MTLSRRFAVCAALLCMGVGAFGQAASKRAETKAEKKMPSYYGPQPETEDLDLTMYARIREEGLRHSHVMEFAGALADGIGPRLTGSPNMAKANAWTRDTMTAIGLSNAHLEDWGEFGMGWQQINTWARMVTPDPEPLWCQAAPWSPATKGPVSGAVVYVDPATADAGKLRGTLGGKIVLLGAMRATPDITEPLFHRYTDEELKEMELYPNGERRGAAGPAPALTPQQLAAERARLTAQRNALLKVIYAEGPAAIITPSRDARDGGGTGVIFDDNGADLNRNAQLRENAVPIPNAVMMIEHYNRLARLVTNKVPVTVELNIEAKFTGDHEHGFDTVAEIPGTDPKLKDQVVMVGGPPGLAGFRPRARRTTGQAPIVAMEADAHSEGAERGAMKPDRCGLRCGAGEEEGSVRVAGLCAPALRQLCGCRRPAPNTPPPGYRGASARTAEDDRGMGDAGRLLQPG